MSYPTRQFDSVFKDMVRATGQPSSAFDSLSATDLVVLSQIFNDAVRQFWDEGCWPGTFAIEQRTIDATDKYILKEETGATVIGEIDPFECFFSDKPVPGTLKYVLDQVEDRGDRIVCFDPNCPSQPYIRFRLQCPEFTRTAWASGTVYAKDDLVYDDTTGETYRSLQAGNIDNAVTDTDWWDRQLFPKIAESFVKWFGSSEWMAENDGKYRQAARAERELDRLVRVYLPPMDIGR